MRIAQIMLAKNFGGAERSFVDLCRALTARGHAVLAICESRSEALQHLERIDGVAIQALTVRGPWDLFARRKIGRYLQEFRADVAQMHLARAASLAGPAARTLGIPSVAKTHNYVNLKYYRTIGKLVPTTARQQEYLRAAGIPSQRLVHIPNFSAFAPRGPAHARRKRSEEVLRVVAIGRLVHKKGFDILLRAVAAARSDGVALTLAIAGSGPGRDALARLCGELQLVEFVTFLGWQDKVEECLECADVFVLPSRDEPFGIVCLEAMALGIPIIATRSDGPSEILAADTAILVDCDDPEALSRALQSVAAEPQQAAARAVAARERFEQHYSEQAVVTQYLELYARLMESR